MTEKQQTAVQWLIEQIMADKTSAWKKEIEQALEMEREQIESAYISGDCLIKTKDTDLFDCASQYFTDTYQSNK